MELGELALITPVNFYSISLDCFYLESDIEDLLLNPQYLLPSPPLLYEEPFALVAMGWNESGIVVEIKVAGKFNRSILPAFEKGDSVELFFNTRDVKTSGFNTKFCHHFYFLPDEKQEVIAKEITHFRTEDRHELCNSDELRVFNEEKDTYHKMRIEIPANCLHGYDPKEDLKLGFTYRINRFSGARQHFSLSSRDYSIGTHSFLWSSLELKR